MAKDYYQVLSVDSKASVQEIRTRFLTLARERHPDLFSGSAKVRAEEEFQGITEAFNILRNPERRRQHDLQLTEPDSGAVRANQGDDLARAYLKRGVAQYKERNYPAAADNFERATREAPQDPRGWYNLALACRRSPKWRSRAVEAIQKACELDSMNVNYLRMAGRILNEAGLKKRAERYYEQALDWSAGEDESIEAALRDLRGK